MKNGIVNELIIAMKERIPKGQNLANSLADILYMGKKPSIVDFVAKWLLLLTK